MAEPSPTSSRLQINYVKTNDFREAACHGALGGVTSHGALWVAFYSERLPLPRVLEYEVTPVPGRPDTVALDEQNSKPVFIETRQGIVRNVEFGVYMNLETAQRVHHWLGEQIKSLQAGGSK